MQLDIDPAPPAQRALVRNLFQFYVHDATDWDPADVEEDGLFSMSDAYFDRYWNEPGWSANVLRVDGRIAGFLLIERSDVPGIDAPEFADLFILKSHRRRGIAAAVVQRVIADSGRPWVVTAFDADANAMAFWRSMFRRHGFAPVRQLPDPHGRATQVWLLNAA